MIHPYVFTDQIEEEVTLYPNPLQLKSPAKCPLDSPEGFRRNESTTWIEEKGEHHYILEKFGRHRSRVQGLLTRNQHPKKIPGHAYFSESGNPHGRCRGTTPIRKRPLP